MSPMLDDTGTSITLDGDGSPGSLL